MPNRCICDSSRRRSNAHHCWRPYPYRAEESVLNITFENKVALLTGEGSGLGLATAKAFASLGAAVVLADWNVEAVQSAVDALRTQGSRALAVQCDVSDDARCKQ
nr:SDR family NAD(P)-dependent oxidoreductase [Burkholderia cepacia]